MEETAYGPFTLCCLLCNSLGVCHDPDAPPAAVVATERHRARFLLHARRRGAGRCGGGGAAATWVHAAAEGCRQWADFEPRACAERRAGWINAGCERRARAGMAENSAGQAPDGEGSSCCSSGSSGRARANEHRQDKGRRGGRQARCSNGLGPS